MARIYISSTFSDLKECREAVYKALRAMGHDVIAMEDYVATDQRPLDKCLDDVASCDLYVGIFAWRYGYVPDRDNPEKKSITELEFRHATDKGIHRLLFLLDEATPWTPTHIERGEGEEKLKLLRAELRRDFTVSFFKSCEQLATKASAAVGKWSKDKSDSSSGDKKAEPAARRVSISRLPVTGRDLFGRDEQLQRLDAAWDNAGMHVLTLVAWGGVGKSALVNYWLAQMARDDYRGADRVYAWSFYSQGTNDRAVSADQFIEAALKWFGDPDPNKGSPWDKGERLAQLVASRRTLLILDGLEPLQNPPGEGEGRLKDQALQSLLRSLAAHNRGLCLISTRVAVADLAPYEDSTAPRIDLDTLTPEAGAQVLKAQGAKGTEDELKRASEEFGGHSLALTLLGSYLSDVYGGDIARRTEVADLESDMRYGGHAQRVMKSYEKWFGEGAELSVLCVLGLFNRPADKGSIDALRAAPAIPGLTDALQGLTEARWQQTLSKLRRAKLLALPSPNQPGTLDTHPLVREHFGHQLKRDNPGVWREGNNRLYEHLRDTAKELPDTLEEMAPLYAAIAHGCEAGRFTEAINELYRQRILRGNQYFSWKKFGNFGTELAMLSKFFEARWTHPAPTLNDTDRGFVWNETGFHLMASGRLAEAVGPVLAALKIFKAQKDFDSVAVSGGNLSKLYLDLGSLTDAMVCATECREFVGDGCSVYNKVGLLVAEATALHHLGKGAEARAMFQQAERLHQRVQPDFPFLYALRGFRYCDFLLDEGEQEATRVRARQTLESTEYARLPFFSTGLAHLTMGQAHLVMCEQGAAEECELAKNQIEKAVSLLRYAYQQRHIACALLTRARFRRACGELVPAQHDVDAALEITEWSNMRRFECDVHLEYARLYLARGEREKARESWEKAKVMVERMGYHRRDRDVAEIEEQLRAAGG